MSAQYQVTGSSAASISASIEAGVRLGDWVWGDRLPPIRVLAENLHVSPATVAKAYELLRSEGLVATNIRSGSTIARDPSSGPPLDGVIEHWRARLFTLLAEAHAQGLTAEAILANCQDVIGEFGDITTGGNERCSGST